MWRPACRTGAIYGAGALILLGGLALGGFAFVESSAALRCRPMVALAMARVPFHADCYALAESSALDAQRMGSLLRVRSEAQLAATRRQLITYLWGTADLPTDRLPSRIETGITDPRFAATANLARIDRLDMELEFGFLARAYHFVPQRGNGRLAVYYEGHDGSFADLAGAMIAALLDAGYAVLAFDMPMRGMNGWPRELEVPGLGPVGFASGSHWNLALLERDDFPPVRLFFDPVLRGLNHLTRTAGPQQIIMLGISGGGWATTVYAALDPRIRRSYPVAGSLPFPLRRAHPGSGRYTSDGDYEQRDPRLYRIAGYLDLYLLGATGQGRRQVQILNKYDPCCFFGDEATIYAPVLAEAVAGVGAGGAFRLIIDDTHASHAISRHARQLILADALEP